MTTIETTLKIGKILDIYFNITRKEGVLRAIRARVQNKTKNEAKFLLVTPNPEQIMRARHDAVYKNIINSAEISLPDGVGMLAAYRFQSKKMPTFVPLRLIYALFYGLWVGVVIILAGKRKTTDLQIIRGRDIFYDLMKLANKMSLRVYFLGSRAGVAQKAADNMAKSFRRIKFASHDAPEVDENGKSVSEADLQLERGIIQSINGFKPHFLVLGIAPPKQEKWIKRNWDGLDFVGAFALGATLDFAAGNLPLPPKWMADFGLEWVWRLITSRKTGKSAKRIFSAFPGFPWIVFWKKVMEPSQI